MDIQVFIANHPAGILGYVVLFLGMLFEAMLTLFAGVFLMVQGALNPYIAGPIIVAGAFGEQLFLYWIGRSLGRSKFLTHWINKAVDRFDSHMLDRTFRTLIISKFVYGLHRTVLLRAGMLRIRSRTFIKYSFAATGVWLVIYFFIGYMLSTSYSYLKQFGRWAELIPLGILILFLLGQYLFSKRFSK